MMERITSRQNPLLQHVKKLQSSSAYRKTHRQFVGDGTKLLEEALRWYPSVETVILSEGIAVEGIPDHVRQIQVPPSVMESISQMKAPQGALFVCAMPAEEELTLTQQTLVLEGIQDPGNLGTMLRTADAFGISVVLLEGCADPYQPKVVRAAMGAMFRHQPLEMTRETLVAMAKEEKIPLIATALRENAQDITKCDLSKAAVVIGSEGRGISQELLDLADQAVIIPMKGHSESLNAAVAATIVLWQMQGG